MITIELGIYVIKETIVNFIMVITRHIILWLRKIEMILPIVIK